MNKKNKKQYYKIKIDPNKVMTERDVRETLYGQVPKSPFEILGYELSYGYFNKYVVLIISILCIMLGLLIGGLDFSRRFCLPASEVFSLTLSKSEYAYSPVEGRIVYANDDSYENSDYVHTVYGLPEGFNFDGATVNIYQGDVYIGDTYEGEYNHYENKDNQNIDVHADQSSEINREGMSNEFQDMDYNETIPSDDNNSVDQIPEESEDEVVIESDMNEPNRDRYNISSEEDNVNFDSPILYISKYTEGIETDSEGDNEKMSEISDQGVEENDNYSNGTSTNIDEPINDTGEVEVITIGDSSQVEDVGISNSNTGGFSPLHREIIINLFWVIVVIGIMIYIKKRGKG